MSTHDLRITALECQVAELRAELEAMGDGIRTRRLVIVGDDDRTVSITPGGIDVSHDATGCHATLHVAPNSASLGVVAGDTVHAVDDERMTVWLEATREYGIVGEPDKRAAVEINGVELEVPQPVR